MNQTCKLVGDANYYAIPRNYSTTNITGTVDDTHGMVLHHLYYSLPQKHIVSTRTRYIITTSAGWLGWLLNNCDAEIHTLEVVSCNHEIIVVARSWRLCAASRRWWHVCEACNDGMVRQYNMSSYNTVCSWTVTNERSSVTNEPEVVSWARCAIMARKAMQKALSDNRSSTDDGWRWDAPHCWQRWRCLVPCPTRGMIS